MILELHIKFLFLLAGSGSAELFKRSRSAWREITAIYSKGEFILGLVGKLLQSSHCFLHGDGEKVMKINGIISTLATKGNEKEIEGS